MYIYKSHMGGFYTNDEYLDYDYLYCEECGDDDWCIGQAETQEEAWALLEDEADIDGSGGYDLEYITNFIRTNFDEE